MAEVEHVGRIEPCMLESFSTELADILTQLPASALALSAGLHPRTAASLAELVRVMNCYYSNLIEGHNTRPRDIERALNEEFDSDPRRRDLQLEAKAHIRVQREIDRLHAAGKLGEPAGAEFLQWLHVEFYRDAPETFLHIGDGSRRFEMQPGQWRSRPEHDVAVGRHLPPCSARVPEFMQHFSERFRLAALSPSQRLVAIAAAHHRFNYIHPFPDGNGRVSRLMSHAMCLFSGLGARGLWSVSRGLARGLASRQDYKQMMDAADSPREGDYDGRGNLSLRHLESFVTWFLRVCLDETQFMASQFQFSSLGARLTGYVAASGLRSEAARLVEEVMLRGELARGDCAAVIRMSERSARDVLKSIENLGLLASETPKGPVSLRFGVESAERLFPDLFPQT